VVERIVQGEARRRVSAGKERRTANSRNEARGNPAED
jgi:hypothetical protein